MKQSIYFILIGFACCLISCKKPQTVINASGTPIFDVLIFSKIETGKAALKQLSTANGYRAAFSEDASIFSDQRLSEFEVIVFLSTTGDILNKKQQAAMERFIQSGRGFVGIHSATDTEYDWPWYNKLVGAYFADHPPGVHQAEIKKTNKHRSTSHLPENWSRIDEWYNFKSVNPETIKILNLDESTYTGGTMGAEHPIAWYHEFDGGRAWYTAGGHTKESFSEAHFMTHVLEGIKYAAGR